ncbi:MAG: hypothetical protein AAF658_20920, partial [Myxococcota bacterium]
GSAPSNPTNETAVSLTVSGSDVAAYRFRVDGGPYSALVSVGVPIELSGLGEGPHSVEVLGSDALGNEQQAPTVVLWVVDITPPDGSGTTVGGGPPSVTPGGTDGGGPPGGTPGGGTGPGTGGPIVVGGDEIVEYVYVLDGGPQQGPFPVSVPIDLPDDLAPGVHVLEISGIDAAGNVQTPPTVITWTIDPNQPVIATLSVPPLFTNATSVELQVGGTDVIEYEYTITTPGGTGMPVGPIAVATPLTVDTSAEEGVFTVAVLGIDASAAKQTVATEVSFTVDRSPPTVVLANAPDDPTSETFLNVLVGGAGVATYRYDLDGTAEAGPFDISTAIAATGLADGAHTLSVWGSDEAGNEQPTPTTVTWTVTTSLTTPVRAIVTGAPMGNVFDTSA